MLFTPGTRADRVGKALARRAADVVVADLEDAVAPEEKADARAAVRAALQEANGEYPLAAVRINAWSSGLAAADLEAVVPARPGLVVLPKAERRADVVALDVALARLEHREGLARGATPVVLIVETARGVVEAARLAGASPRVVALAFGAEDLAADAGLRRSAENEEVLAARSHVALAAAAARRGAVDQVFVDLADRDGLAREARAARALGYRGKMVVHPDQVPVVHEAFAPSPEELEQARRLVAAAAEGKTQAGGVLRFGGRMIDVPLIEQARRLVAEAEAAERVAAR